MILGAANPGPILAFLAGLASFLSPCIFPVIPSYLSYIGGVSYDELKDGKANRFGILIKTLFFVLGFSIIFSIFGALSSGIGSVIGRYSQVIQIVAGSIVILLGLHFIFDFFKLLNFEKRFNFEKRPSGNIGAILIGMAFGAGWTPCIGPILASILALAASSGKTTDGVFLLLIYSAGLGIPFILAGVFFSAFSKQMQKIKPHLKKIKIGSGLFLIFIGALILLGRFQDLNVFFAKTANGLAKWKEQSPNGPNLLFGAIFLAPALLTLFFYIKKILKIKKENPGASPLRWGRIIRIILFLTLSVLSFTGIVDFSAIIYQWFNYEGI